MYGCMYLICVCGHEYKCPQGPGALNPLELELQAYFEKKLFFFFFKATAARFVKSVLEPGMVAQVFNPSTWEAEAGGFLSSRPAWSTK